MTNGSYRFLLLSTVLDIFRPGVKFCEIFDDDSFTLQDFFAFFTLFLFIDCNHLWNCLGKCYSFVFVLHLKLFFSKEADSWKRYNFKRKNLYHLISTHSDQFRFGNRILHTFSSYISAFREPSSVEICKEVFRSQFFYELH